MRPMHLLADTRQRARAWRLNPGRWLFVTVPIQVLLSQWHGDGEHDEREERQEAKVRDPGGEPVTGVGDVSGVGADEVVERGHASSDAARRGAGPAMETGEHSGHAPGLPPLARARPALVRSALALRRQETDAVADPLHGLARDGARPRRAVGEDGVEPLLVPDDSRDTLLDGGGELDDDLREVLLEL